MDYFGESGFDPSIFDQYPDSDVNFENINNTDAGVSIYESPPVDVALVVFRLLVCVIGIIGNLLVIFVILVLAEYKKAVTHWYVLQLAIADTLFLVTIPFKVVESINDSWTFATWMCKAKETILFLNYYSSILFLVVMSLDRYIAVCHGFSGFLQKFRTPFASLVITCVIWTVSLSLCIPVMLYSGVYGLEPNCKCQYQFPATHDPAATCVLEGYVVNTTSFDECLNDQELAQNEEGCVWLSKDIAYGSGESDLSWITDLFELQDEIQAAANASNTSNSSISSTDQSLHMGCHYYSAGRGFVAFILFNFIAMFIVPLLIMTVCYALIVMRLKKTRVRTESNEGRTTSIGSSSAPSTSTSRKKRSKSAASAKDNKNRIRVTVMCACLVILFLVCWLPFHSVHLAKMQGISGSTEYCANIFYIASLIAYVNSAINPYLYNFIGTRFGKRLRSAASTVRKSVKRRTSSISGSVRYQYRKRQTDGGTSSQAATVFTKVTKGKSEIRSGDMSSNVFSEESKEQQQRLFDNTNRDQSEKIATASIDPPPDYHNYKNEIQENIEVLE